MLNTIRQEQPVEPTQKTRIVRLGFASPVD